MDVNPPTLKTWGRGTVEEIRGQTTDDIFGPGATEHYMPVVEKIMNEGIPHSFEDYFPNLDRHFRFTSVPLGDRHFITTGADITAIKKAQDALNRLNELLESKVRERTVDLHAANRALEERAAQLRELAGELTTAEQRERRSPCETAARWPAGSTLVAARLRQSAVISELGNHAARQSAQDVESLLAESINVSRSLATELCPPVLDGGILAGLEWLSRFMASKHGLDVDLVIESGAPVLPEDVKVFLFESVRELLLNVVKHSKVLHAKVLLKEEQNRLNVTVSDSGKGFDVGALQRRGRRIGASACFRSGSASALWAAASRSTPHLKKAHGFTLSVPIGKDRPRSSSCACSAYGSGYFRPEAGRIRVLVVDGPQGCPPGFGKNSGRGR